MEIGSKVVAGLHNHSEWFLINGDSLLDGATVATYSGDLVNGDRDHRFGYWRFGDCRSEIWRTQIGDLEIGDLEIEIWRL